MRCNVYVRFLDEQYAVIYALHAPDGTLHGQAITAILYQHDRGTAIECAREKRTKSEILNGTSAVHLNSLSAERFAFN